MRSQRAWSCLVLTMSAVLFACSAGCAYLRDRGRDAADMMEIGITVTRTPQFAFHPIDYFNLITLGYSSVDGQYYGIGERRIGKMRFKDELTWGLLFWGSDTLKIGTFNPYDPHLAWTGDMARLQAEGKPLPTERPRYNKGLIRVIAQGNSPPPVTFLQCRRNIHLGWIGLHLSLRPLDIIDFILGWTTLDIIGDDASAQDARRRRALAIAWPSERHTAIQ